MPVTFHLNEVDPAVKWNEDGTMTDLTAAMPYVCMMIEMGTISKVNAQEFYKRICIYRVVVSPALVNVPDSSIPLCLTLKSIQDHIGFHSNIPTETFAHFMIKCRHILLEQANREVAEALEALKPVAPVAVQSPV